MTKCYIAFILFLCGAAYFLGMNAYTLATEPEPPATPSPTQEVIPVATIDMSTPTPCLTPTQRVPTPTPSPTPEWPEDVDFDEGECRCLARFLQSVVPSKATMITKIVACETVQNRVDSGKFKDTIRYTLLMHSEYPSYSPKARIIKENAEAAEFAMRSWVSDDWVHRYTPPTGIYLRFSDDGKYVKVYDWDWNLVCDTEWFK